MNRQSQTRLQTSDFMYAAAPFAALMMTYGTLSPRLGALPASLFLILENINMRRSIHPYHTHTGSIFSMGIIDHLSASSTCACLLPYSWAVRVSSLVMTSWLMSIRLHSRSEITSLAWSTAPWGSLKTHQTSCDYLQPNNHHKVYSASEDHI